MATETIQINIDKVIRERMPGGYRFIPKFIIRALERLICQDNMNSLLKTNGNKEGKEFCQGVLEYLDITCEVRGIENLPDINDIEGWKVFFVCNHPLGGLDGMALIDLISSHAPNGKMKFIVNDLLMNIPSLRTVFLPVNTISGKQSKEAAAAIDRTLNGPEPVAIFPAGLCSRLIKNVIQDKEWNKMFINKAIQYKRDIIPIHFKGENSGFFYKFAKIRKMLHIPVNLEMTLLPREVFRNRNGKFQITIGKRIPWQSLKGGINAVETAQKIRELVYTLPYV